MRIHYLSLVAALTISGFTSGLATDAFAAQKEVSMGCTMAQLNTDKAKACIDMITKKGGTEHHLECNGGEVSCCNDEKDSGGRPAGFCITIKKNVQTKRPKVIETPAVDIQ